MLLLRTVLKRGSIAIGFVIALAGVYFFAGWSQVHPNIAYGVTWSEPYAAELGIDPHQALVATLDDLGVRRFRIPAYWSLIEPSRDNYDFRHLDRIVDVIAKRNGKILLVIGTTQPRWPECWMPEWVAALDAPAREGRQLRYIDQVMRRYERHPSLEGWQVENEPTLIVFGQCKNQRKAFLRDEIRYVQARTEKPVITTDSGELSTWLGFAGLTDGRGVSVYRVILTQYFGIWRYPFPPFLYARKAALVEWLVGKVFVSEFQMEPWARAPLPSVPVVEQFETFSIGQMRSNFDYATKIGLSPVYFWGVEWWYWMKEHHQRPEFWTEAKQFFRSHP